MGYDSGFVVNNDFIHTFEDNPQFGRFLSSLASYHGNPERQRHCALHYGVHTQAIQCFWNQHADVLGLCIVGDHQARVLATNVVSTPSNKETEELALLRLLAAKHGYNLHKKPTPK